MNDTLALAMVAIPLMLLFAAIIALCFAHMLEIVGIGEGTPWTKRAPQTLYKGDASPLVFVLTLGSILSVMLFHTH